MTGPGPLCASCGAGLPSGARFCPSCGTALVERPSAATERKVVTTLFADIVGFTALSEQFDPEDVDAGLRGYFEMARATVERFGGSVEKFIGDAVVGVFGIPTAHEDDAERAVRAALAIVEGMASLPQVGDHALQVRVGVNTGRSLVRLDVSFGSGEGALVGDAVNTAARLLTAAAPMSVVVGKLTRSLSARAIEYDQLDPVTAKGKSQPLDAWLARRPIARRGIDGRGVSLAPLVGREVELAVLEGLLAKAIASATAQFALLVGEAGIGKSRLVTEFFRTLDERPGFFCTWRQGRCPPYGEDLAYWPLREIVTAHAGILQTDRPHVVEKKLRRALGDIADHEWMVTRLLPLVGLPAAQTEHDDNFAAWQLLLEGIARRQPIDSWSSRTSTGRQRPRSRSWATRSEVRPACPSYSSGQPGPSS